MAVVHDHVVRFRDHKLSSWTGLKQLGSSVTIGQHSDPLKHFRSRIDCSDRAFQLWGDLSGFHAGL
jgi:hypothetical protein